MKKRFVLPILFLLVVGFGGHLYAADGDPVLEGGSPTFAGVTVSPSATPHWEFRDSDDAAGTATIYGNSSGGTNDIVMSIGVEDSGGEDQAYIELDGVNERIEFKKYVEDIELGAATDTTIARSGAGDVTIEGNQIHRAGGTDITVPDGGTGAGTFTDGGVLLGSGTGAITPMAVLSDSEMIVGDGTTDPVAESGATLRTSIGVGTGNSPQFTGIELGHATDTTVARSGAGTVTIEGSEVTMLGQTIGASEVDADVATQSELDNVAPTNITPVDTADENATFYPILVDGATGSQATETDGEFTFNPSTGVLTATEFSGGGASLTAVDAATGDHAASFFDAGEIEVARGGTGVSTLADGGLVIGNAENDVEVVAAGTTTQILVGGGASTAPAWGTDIPTAVTIGSAYVYRAGGTDVADDDVANNITITAGSQIASGSPTFTAVTSPSVIVDSIDTTGAADIDIGSADVTDITFMTDGDYIFTPPADTDITMTFTGTTASGAFKWMEDEDYFQFSDAVVFDLAATFTGDIDVGDDVLLADGAVVGITGNEVITFNAAGSINVTGATMDVDGAFTATSVTADAAVVATTEVQVGSSNADPSANAGALRHDSTVSNFTNGALTYYNGAAIKQVVDMTTATASACTDDQVVAYDADADLWYCKDDADAATTMYGRTAYIGGTASVDNIPSAGLADGDLCIVITSADVATFHRYESSSDAVEDSPMVIDPDDNGAADGRWILTTIATGAEIVINDDHPGILARDTDAPVRTDNMGSIYWEYIDGAGGAENSNVAISIMQGGTPNTIVLQFDEDEDQWEIPAGAGITFDEPITDDPDDADVKLSAADGVLTIAALNGEFNDDLTIDFDSTENEVVVGTGEGVTNIDFGGISLESSGGFTGDVSGSAATVTGATQASITTTANLTTVGALASGSLAAGFTDVPVAQGGTGASTLADGGLVIGNAASAVEVVAAGATTEVLVGGGASTAPVWTTAQGTGAPVRAGSPTLTTPNIGAATGTSLDISGAAGLVLENDETITNTVDGTIDFGAAILTSTGTLHGAIEIIADDESISAAQCYGSLNKTNGAATFTLPAAVAGMNILIYSDDATVKTIDPNGTDHIWLNGADNGAGNSIDSPGAVGDFIVLVAMSANNWYSLGQSGTWIDTP